MSRPLRIPLAGGLYHVTSRGNHQDLIYFDDRDRLCWLDVLGNVAQQVNWRVHAWCQMNNHYHLVIETPEPNLSHGMRLLNGTYTQRINRRYDRTGHLFQGRFHAVLVERQSHLLELLRYVVLNPVRAKIVENPSQWPWSSYRAMTGKATPPPWLEMRWTLAQFGTQSTLSIARYGQFILAGVESTCASSEALSSAALGSTAFVETALQAGFEVAAGTDLTEIRHARRRPQTPPLRQFQLLYQDPREAMARAYASGGYTLRMIGTHFGVHRTSVAKAVRMFRTQSSNLSAK